MTVCAKRDNGPDCGVKNNLLFYMNWKTFFRIIAEGQYLLLPLALLLFTAYAFLQPDLSPRLHPISIVIVLLCVLQHLLNRTNITFSSTVYWIVGYIVLGGISILLPPSDLASSTIWIDAVISIFLGLIVWSAFNTANQKTEKIFEWLIFILCFLFAVAIILQNIDGGRLSPRKLECLAWLTMPLNIWIQKYQEIWLLLLTWVGIAYLPFSTKWKGFFAGLMLLSCGFALFFGYSKGSQTAFILSTVFFICGNTANKFPQKILTFLVMGIVISIPLCSGLALFFSQFADLYIKTLNMVGKASRIVIWDYVFESILYHPWFGFGFGAAHTIDLPLYPGKHPHSVTVMILLDLGLLGLVFYMGFLYNIILRISRAPVSLFKTMASGSLLLACVIFWQVSFSFWNLECLLLLCVSSGLMGLRLRNHETENPILSGSAIHYIYKNKTILVLLLIGTVTFGISYVKEVHFINKIESAEISLSKDLTSILIDGQAFLINHQQGGILRIIPGDSHELTFKGWAGDISEGKKAQAVIIFYAGQKIGVVIPSIYRAGFAKEKRNTDLLFSGFSCMIDDNKCNFIELKKISGVALFNNGEARFLKYVPFVNLG